VSGKNKGTSIFRFHASPLWILRSPFNKNPKRKRRCKFTSYFLISNSL